MCVLAFFLDKVAEQLSDACILGLSRGDFIKAFSFQFHAFGTALHGFKSERTHQPDRTPIHEPSHVLPPDERHVVAETRFVKIE